MLLRGGDQAPFGAGTRQAAVCAGAGAGPPALPGRERVGASPATEPQRGEGASGVPRGTGRPVRQRPGLRTKAVPSVWASSGPHSVHVAAKRTCPGHGDRQEGVRSGQGAVEGGAAHEPPGPRPRAAPTTSTSRTCARKRAAWGTRSGLRRAGSGPPKPSRPPSSRAPPSSPAAGCEGGGASYRRSHRVECATGACAGADAAPCRPGLRAGRGMRAGEPARAPVLPPHASAGGPVRMP